MKFYKIKLFKQFTDSKHMEASDLFVKKYRIEAGYKSARAFFQTISDKAQLNFNYSYYTRIESGDVLPSIAIIKQLAKFLPPNLAEGLICDYCSTIFSDHAHLFEKTSCASTVLMEPEKKSNVTLSQDELTARQIAFLKKSKRHYYCFLLLTLARHQLSQKQLEESLALQVGSLAPILEDLSKVKIAYQDQEKMWHSSSSEFRFPKAYCQEIKEAYDLFNQWDLSLDKELALKVLKRKFFFRRTSPKFITLILSLLNHTDELVRTSEEIDERLNDEVFMLEYRLGVGRLAG